MNPHPGPQTLHPSPPPHRVSLPPAFRDAASGYTFVAATPTDEPELWTEFVDGARTAYRRYGVEAALEYDRIADGSSSVLFFAALGPDGAVVGGSRAIGPYRTVDEAHPFVEWTDPDSRAAIRRILEPCLPHGLVEGKTGWVADGVPRRRELSIGVARTATYYMELLGARFLVGTAADNALGMWLRCGARLQQQVTPASYPDDRYRTRLLLWDRARCGSAERSRELAQLEARDEW